MRPEVLVSTLAGLAACQGDAPDPATTPARVVEARGADGAVRSSATVTGDECAAGGLRIRREGDEVVGRRGAAVVGSIAASGDVTLGGARHLRTVRRPGKLDLLDLEGVPVARLTADGDRARVVDAARSPIFAITREPDRLVVADAEGKTALVVTGTSDLLTAALLGVPGLDPAAAHLLVCERLLDEPRPKTHDRRANQHP